MHEENNMDFFEALEIMLKDFEKHLGWKQPERCGSGLQIVNIVQKFEENRTSAHNKE